MDKTVTYSLVNLFKSVRFSQSARAQACLKGAFAAIQNQHGHHVKVEFRPYSSTIVSSEAGLDSTGVPRS